MNRFRSKQQFSQCKVQSTAKTFKWNRRLRGLMTGKVLLLGLNVTVQLVKEFIRFCACELIMCGITALEVEGPDVLLATGMGFAVQYFPLRRPTKAVVCLHLSRLKTGYFRGQ